MTFWCTYEKKGGQVFAFDRLVIYRLGEKNMARTAITAGLIIGVIEVFSVEFVNSAFRHLIAFVCMFAILLLKPSGLFGGLQLKNFRGD